MNILIDFFVIKVFISFAVMFILFGTAVWFLLINTNNPIYWKDVEFIVKNNPNIKIRTDHHGFYLSSGKSINIPANEFLEASIKLMELQHENRN